MKLNLKITILLAVSFFVISLAFISAALLELGHNQADNLSLFKNEFVQTNLESFQNSSDLFFSYLDNEIAAGKIVTYEDLNAFSVKNDQTGDNIIFFGLRDKNLLSSNQNPELVALLDQKTIDSYVSRWILNPAANDFAADNLDRFSAGDTGITPARVRVKIYDKLGLMIGYGKVFETGKVRIEFIQQRNENFYWAYFTILLTIFILAATLIPLFSIWFMKKAVINPIKRLNAVTQEITEGNLGKRVDIKSSDEIGALSTSFNKMTEKLIAANQVLQGKVKELSEEHGRLSSLVESVKLGVVMVDLSLRVIMSNSAARAAFGKTSTKDLTFKDLVDKIKSKVDLSQALSSYVRSGTPMNIQEVVIGDKYYRLFMSPVRDIVQKIFIGAVFVMEDITDEKKLNQMRSEIVSITSHQLRTPATIIKGNLDMVLGGDVGKITKKQKELLDDTYMGNERMIRLVNDLMDASKIDEGRFALPSEPVDFADLVGETVKEMMPFAVKKRVVLAFERPAEPLPKAKINRQKVKQVLQNLIDNAIKYSSSGKKGKVTVTAQKDGAFLGFAVKDNGIGIPVADQGKIFERFYRGSNSTKLDPGGGSGLGLYIAKGVVEQGGGKIWFETKEGEGTTFNATFPIN